MTAAVDDVRRWWPIGRGEQPRVRRHRHAWPATTPGSTVATRRVGFRRRRPRHHAPMATVLRSPSSSTAGGRGSVASTGSPTTASPLESRRRDSPPASTRRSRPTPTCCACGAAACTSPTTSTTSATAVACSCGRTSPSPVRPIPRSCSPPRCAPRRSTTSTRLMAHPSLLVWCGNNENLWGFADWGWRERLAGRPWGEGFYRSLLPGVVAELDPDRPYIDGSPTSLDPAIAPQRRPLRRGAPVGRVERPTTTSTTGPTRRGSSPSSASRHRRPIRRCGRALAGRPLDRRRSGAGPSPEGARW